MYHNDEMATFVIKASSVSNAGNGVFVTKDYNKGDYVCFYDGEDVDITDQDEYSMGHPTNPNMTRKGFRDVRTPDGVAQFINDFRCEANANVGTNEFSFKVIPIDMG